MSNRLDVRSVTKVTTISNWCLKNLKDEDWRMEVLSIFPSHYKFEFKDPHMSTMAVLSS